MVLLLVCVSILTYIIPYYSTSSVSESVFQNLSFLLLFQFPLAPWPLFCLPLCLHHSVPIYFISACLPVLIFVFMLLHSSVSVPHLSFSISILTFLFQSLSSPQPPNPSQLTFTFSLFLSHTHTPILVFLPLFPSLSLSSSITPFLPLLPSLLLGGSPHVSVSCFHLSVPMCVSSVCHLVPRSLSVCISLSLTE